MTAVNRVRGDFLRSRLSFAASISSPGIATSRGQGRLGAEAAHQTQRDDTVGSGVTKATIASAIVGFVISLIGGVVLAVWIVLWFSSCALVLRRLLGYP